jgi:hypothetical protein
VEGKGEVSYIRSGLRLQVVVQVLRAPGSNEARTKHRAGTGCSSQN